MADETPESFLNSKEVKKNVPVGLLKQWSQKAGTMAKGAAIAFLREAYNQVVHGQAHIDNKKGRR